MQILYSSLHNLNMDADDPIRKEIPSDFGPYLESYIEFATTSNDTYDGYVPKFRRVRW